LPGFGAPGPGPRGGPGVGSAANSLAALKSIRAKRPDGAPIYVILDNLSAHKGATIRQWALRNKVELCFTPTYASWVNPIEAHFGPLRTFVIAGSDHGRGFFPEDV
jgi:DDE superfamily endonuclease